MYKLFFLILFSVSSLLALPLLFPDGLPDGLPPSYAYSRIAIGSNPAYITPVYNGRNVTPDALILLVEEELTNSNCSKDSNRSYVLTNTENPEAMKKWRELIEKERQDERNDPRFLPKPNFIIATHLMKGSAAINHGCAMVNLRIEDLKGCVRAQKKISVSGIRKPVEIIDKLIAEATISLRYQICNSKSFEHTSCSKSHYTDELFCPYYYTMRTVVKKIEKQESPVKTGGRKSDLETVIITDAKQVVYIDDVNGKIINVPFIKETTVEKTSQRYKLNTTSCQYQIVTHKDVEPYYKYAPTYITSNSNDKNFTKETVLKLQIYDGERKEINLPWITLKHNGHFSYKSQRTKEKTKSEKATELKEMLKVNEEGKSKLEMLKKALNLEQVLGRDAKCAVERNFYDVLENGANIMHPTVSFKYSINIYQSNKSDIAKAKQIIKRMKNFSGSYTEEKQLYDALNNPLYAPSGVKSEQDLNSNENPDGILDVLVPQDRSEEISIDDLQMFTK